MITLLVLTVYCALLSDEDLRDFYKEFTRNRNEQFRIVIGLIAIVEFITEFIRFIWMMVKRLFKH